MIVPRALVLLAATACLAIAGCGGSASETPWPVEPVNADVGPTGESSARPGANEAEPPPPATSAPAAPAKPAKPAPKR